MTTEELRIVIINDDANDAGLLERCLVNDSERTHVAVVAETGEEGIEVCLSAQTRAPDCVIVDLHLPDMNGLEVLKRLTDKAGDLLFPTVLFIDSGDECKVARAALRAGAHEYIAKSWLTADGLTCAVENAIERFNMRKRLRYKRATLERQDREFKTLVENIPDVITRMDMNHRHVYINQTVERVFGIPPQAFLGKSNREAGLPAALCDFWETVLNQAIAGGRTLTFEFDFEGPLGLRCFQARLVPQCSEPGKVDSVLAVISDVTEGKHLEQTFRAGKEHLRNVIDRLIAFVWVVTPEGILVEANRTALEAAAIKPQAVLGKPLEGTSWWSYAPAVQAELRCAIDRAARGEEVRSDVMIRISDGRFMMIDVMIAALTDGQGKVTHLIISAFDITERKRSEQALKVADRRKDEFLAMLAHELRNPLAAIQTSVHILQLKGDNTPELVWGRQVIDRQAKHLSRLIEDLLDVSRITTGKIQLKLVPIDFRDVVWRAAETVRPILSAKQHDLKVTMPPVPVNTLGDTARLEQVVCNLLTNAAKYTDNNGSIDLSVAQTRSRIKLRIRDNGIGIDPKMLPHIFDLYTQTDDSRSRSHGGLGIGLTLVKKLVELHGGRVSATSEGRGKGSEFVIRLPSLDEKRGQAIESGAGMINFDRSGTPWRPRVLVVDDNVDMALGLLILIQTSGYDVQAAHDGQSALKIAREFRPHYVLLDIAMPEMNGFELAKAFRQDATLRAATLIAISGYGQLDDREQSRAAGFDHHLLKPVDLASLMPILSSPARADRFTREVNSD